MTSKPYADQKLVRDAYRAAWYDHLTAGGKCHDEAVAVYGDLDRLLSSSIGCADDDTGENTPGGFATVSFESGLPWSPFEGPHDLLCEIDDAANAELRDLGSGLRVYTEPHNAATAGIYEG